MHSGQWFVRGISFKIKILKISSTVASFCVPKGTSPLICTKLNSPFPKDASYQIWLKSIQWFLRVSVLNVFPYISLCTVKCPLVGPFFNRFILMCKLYKPCLKDAAYQFPLYLNCRHEKKSFKYLCKMKHPLVGSFLCGFYFYAQTLQNILSKGFWKSNIRVFGMPVHEKNGFF